MLELFMTKTTDIGDFLRLNQRYITNSRIAISREVFQKLWNECLEHSGKIDIKQPTSPRKRQKGIYNFFYTRKNSEGVLEELKVSIRQEGVNRRGERKFQIQAVSAGEFRYVSSKSLLAYALYIDLHHTLKEELCEGRTL